MPAAAKSPGTGTSCAGLTFLMCYHGLNFPLTPFHLCRQPSDDDAADSATVQAGTLPAGHAGATERAALAQALQASRPAYLHTAVHSASFHHSASQVAACSLKRYMSELICGAQLGSLQRSCVEHDTALLRCAF